MRDNQVRESSRSAGIRLTMISMADKLRRVAIGKSRTSLSMKSAKEEGTMNDKSSRPAASIDYKEHEVVVNSHQQADASWVCRYSIVKAGKPKTESMTGQADGSFPSREAAELAAVQKAKALIDLR